MEWAILKIERPILKIEGPIVKIEGPILKIEGLFLRMGARRSLYLKNGKRIQGETGAVSMEALPKARVIGRGSSVKATYSRDRILLVSEKKSHWVRRYP